MKIFIEVQENTDECRRDLRDLLKVTRLVMPAIRVDIEGVRRSDPGSVPAATGRLPTQAAATRRQVASQGPIRSEAQGSGGGVGQDAQARQVPSRRRASQHAGREREGPSLQRGRRKRTLHAEIHLDHEQPALAEEMSFKLNYYVPLISADADVHRKRLQAVREAEAVADRPLPGGEVHDKGPGGGAEQGGEAAQVRVGLE